MKENYEQKRDERLEQNKIWRDNHPEEMKHYKKHGEKITENMEKNMRTNTATIIRKRKRKTCLVNVVL